jgi:glutathione S-transferase
MASEIVVLELHVSPFATRVRIALSHKGVEFESKEEDLTNKSSLLLKMNPVNKKIPVLIHKGKPICESLTIVEYIDEVWNGRAPLLPSDPYGRSHARFWGDYIDKKIYPVGSQLWMKGEAEKEIHSKDLIEAFKVLEGELGEKHYFGGEKFGFVDLALISFNSMFLSFEKLGNFSMETECPKIVEWANRCTRENESVSKSLPHPDKVYQFVLMLKRMFGVE